MKNVLVMDLGAVVVALYFLMKKVMPPVWVVGVEVVVSLVELLSVVLEV